MSEKIYKCCICHKIYDKYDMIRLCKQLYDVGSYKQFSTVDKYDICQNCYKSFERWLKKHEEKEDSTY